MDKYLEESLMIGWRITMRILGWFFQGVILMVQLFFLWFLNREPKEKKAKKDGWYFRLNKRLFGGIPAIGASSWTAALTYVILSIPAMFINLDLQYRITGKLNPEMMAIYKLYEGSTLWWIVAAFSTFLGIRYYPRYKEIRKEAQQRKEAAEAGENDLILGSSTALPEQVRKTHMYIVGKTGSGKSKALQYWLKQDVGCKRGCALIDAHGDVVDDFLAELAQHMINTRISLDEVDALPLMEKLVIVDPTDPEYAVGINPLQTFEPFTPMDTGGQFEEAVKKLWGFDREEAPMMGEIIRYTAYALACNSLTLMEAVLLLTNSRIRTKLAQNLDDEIVKSFLTVELAELEKSRIDAVGPAKRRIRRFVTDKRISPIIGQKKSTLRLRDAIDKGYIILCRIPTTLMGESGSFLGSLLVSQIHQAAKSRATLFPSHRKPYYLYIDEFQKFVSGDFKDILSEMRKYGLHFILAHQYSDQVDIETQNAIYKNVKAMMAFNIDADDSMRLSEEFFTVTGQMVRNRKRSVRFLNVGGVQIPRVEETEDFFNVNEEIKMNAGAFTKLHARQFLAIWEGLEQPVGDMTQTLEDVDQEDPEILKYVAKIKEVSNRRWARPKKEVLAEIKKRHATLAGTPTYEKGPYASGKKKKNT